MTIEKSSRIFQIIKEGDAVSCCLCSETNSVSVVGIITPVNTRAIRITGIEACGWKHLEMGIMLTRWWRFVNFVIFIAANIHAQPLSLEQIRKLTGKSHLLQTKARQCNGKAMFPAFYVPNLSLQLQGVS